MSAKPYDLAAVLAYLRPGAGFSEEGNDYARIVWRGPGTLPTEAECDAAAGCDGLSDRIMDSAGFNGQAASENRA